MALQISGRVYFIGQTESITSKTGGEPFNKRELWIQLFRFNPETGDREESDNYAKLEASGERCALINSLNGGDEVLVTFAIRGCLYESQTTHKQECITRLDLRAIKVTKTLVGGAQTMNAPQQQQPQPGMAAPLPQMPQMFVDPSTGRRYYQGSDGQAHWEDDVNPDGSYK